MFFFVSATFFVLFPRVSDAVLLMVFAVWISVSLFSLPSWALSVISSTMPCIFSTSPVTVSMEEFVLWMLADNSAVVAELSSTLPYSKFTVRKSRTGFIRAPQMSGRMDGVASSGFILGKM